jgi:hypothetical protein
MSRASSSPMMIRASEPPMKERRSVFIGLSPLVEWDPAHRLLLAIAPPFTGKVLFEMPTVVLNLGS